MKDKLFKIIYNGNSKLNWEIYTIDNFVLVAAFRYPETAKQYLELLQGEDE